MESKFCIIISGMDEIIAMHSMGEAVRAAAFLNAEYLEYHTERGTNKNDDGLVPYCFVSPGLWPFDDAEHEKSLKEMEEANGDLPHWMHA